MILADRKAIPLFYITLISIFLIGCGSSETVIEGPTMGTSYKVVIKTDKNIDSGLIRSEIDSILNVVNKQMSTYDDSSEISAFNNEKENVDFKISDHFFTVLDKSFYYYQESKRLFDVTIHPLYKLWGFQDKNDSNTEPSQEKIDSALELVGMDLLEFRKDKKAISKKNSKISIDLSAIAKGYAVDLISKYLNEKGYENHFVEIGGEIKVQSTGDENWEIGVQVPDFDKINQVIDRIYLSNHSIATSGNYANTIQYLSTGTERTHIINPLTGTPLEVGDGMIASATVVSKECVDADALATTLMLLDIDKGIDLIESLDATEAYIIYLKDSKLHTRETEGFKDYRSESKK